MHYSFNLYNQGAVTGIIMALSKFLEQEKNLPVILCIGSDLVTGDALGPVTGTLIESKAGGLPVYVYGDLSTPVTAKEVQYADGFIRRLHPGRKIIAIDAAVGEAGDVGSIQVRDVPLHPGSGAKKQLGKAGDLSILGIVAERSLFNYAVLGAIRLNVVYKMSEVIAEAVATILWDKCSQNSDMGSPCA